ncbi:YrbL family protein [Saccharospirillum sp. HFRX-1]|uniref:YrbL family protein n=1 Tax=Saccharospirillum sp. HFRX-1 TaxID=3157713 RepID=UPI00371772C2
MTGLEQQSCKVTILGPLSLKSGPPLLSSKTRWVYEHPHDSSLLVKVHIPRGPGAQQSGIQAWFAAAKDYFLYSSGMVRELRHFVESRYRDQGLACSRICPIHGVVETDLGLGLLVSAARSADGSLAPTLQTLMDNRLLTASQVADLRALLDSMVDSTLTFADMNYENLVLEHAGDDSERFVIIDGLGDRTWIPTQRWFRSVRRSKKREFQQRVERRLSSLGYD